MLAAILINGQSRQGQTLPFHMWCFESEASRAGGFLVKVASKRTHQTPEVLATEYMCTVLARAAGLHALSPKIVQLPEEIRDQLDQDYKLPAEDEHVFALPVCNSLRAFESLRHPDLVDSKIRAKLIALDTLLSNGDRVPENPNLAWDQDQLLVFDFGMCCALRASASDKEFLEHFCSGVAILKSHALYSSLLKAQVSKALSDLLVPKNRVALERVVGDLPANWHPQAVKIVEYIGYCIKKRKELLRLIEGEF